MSGRDWTKERWRKQYIREPLQHRAWPVMARGLRELLNALAEDDGTLVRDVEDPIEALMRGLHAQEYELELVEAALGLLLREGFLAGDEHSIWIPDLPRAQAQRDAPPASVRTPSATDTRQTSTERVRAVRARQRERNAAAVSDGAVPETGDAASPVSDDVSAPVGAVSFHVSPSRGDSHPESSERSEIQRNPEEQDHPDQSSAARGIVSARPRDVSAELVSTRWTDDEVSKFARNPEQALKLPVHERAVFLRSHPRLADAHTNFLKSVSLGELGARIEFTIHNQMHMRFCAEPSTGIRPDADPTDPGDKPEYDWLGDTYSSHVNSTFWKLHGWVDDRITAWASANGVTDIQWKGTWLGKMPSQPVAFSFLTVMAERAGAIKSAESSHSHHHGHVEELQRIVRLIARTGKFCHFYDRMELPG